MSDHTSFWQDAGIVCATVVVLEVIKWAFGLPVAFAVAVTALIAIVAFLYHAGRSA